MRFHNFGSFVQITEFLNAMRECETDDGPVPAPAFVVVRAKRSRPARKAASSAAASRPSQLVAGVDADRSPALTLVSRV